MRHTVWDDREQHAGSGVQIGIPFFFRPLQKELEEIGVS